MLKLINYINFKNMSQQKGFTIIELIVVIAIIAVLATIVSTNVLGYVAKSKNTAIKANMANLIVYGLTYYTDNAGSYSGFCTSPKVLNFQTAINSSAAPNTSTCDYNSANEAWCTVVQLQIPLASNHPTNYCVDSTGKKLEKYDAFCSSGVCAVP